MALINKKWILSFLLALITLPATAHTIFAPNDIPLLDNRFRIDPNTEQVTIILNHPSHKQNVVLVKPDGSKLYARRHPVETVAWFNNPNQDIITIQNPMPGPWQAIATLDGENRIQLLNPISLNIEKLPLKVYTQEYLTSYLSLLKDGQVITDKDLLKNAKLTVSLIGEQDDQKLISLYKDDGQYYDSLPFDGKLTAHFFLDLIPGRYLLNIKTQNNIFTRSVNRDVIIFPQPLIYKVQQLDDKAQFTFVIDQNEIAPESVTIEALISSNSGTTQEQMIVNFIDHELKGDLMTIEVPLSYDSYNYSGKVYATSIDGRELNFELPKQDFVLNAPQVQITPEITAMAPTTATDANTPVVDSATPTKKEEEVIVEEESSYLWIIISVLAFFVLFIIFIVLYLLKRKQKKLLAGHELSLDELTADEVKMPEKNNKKAKK